MTTNEFEALPEAGWFRVCDVGPDEVSMTALGLVVDTMRKLTRRRYTRRFSADKFLICSEFGIKPDEILLLASGRMIFSAAAGAKLQADPEGAAVMAAMMKNPAPIYEVDTQLSVQARA